MAGISLLCVEADPVVGRFIRRELGARSIAVILTGPDAMPDALRLNDVHAVILDDRASGAGPVALLTLVLAERPQTPVVVLTGSSDPNAAVVALKAGAADCVTLDLDAAFVDRLETAVRACIAASRDRREKENDDRALRHARDRFEALAAERQILLHEVNHRVGNSLQLIGAFLHMQASSSGPDTRQALDEANRRVIAIAQLHKRLYATEDVQSIALHHYLDTLVEDIRLSMDGEGIGDLLSVAADEVSIDPDNAVTIGIIVTELVINAMKYAYPGSRGPIRVALQSVAPPGTLRLAVEDDGVGMKQRAGSPTGIGRTIIGAMATKLGSTVDYAQTETGTRASMSFLSPGQRR